LDKERIRNYGTYNNDERGSPGGRNGYPSGSMGGVVLFGIVLRTGIFEFVAKDYVANCGMAVMNAEKSASRWPNEAFIWWGPPKELYIASELIDMASPLQAWSNPKWEEKSSKGFSSPWSKASKAAAYGGGGDGLSMGLGLIIYGVEGDCEDGDDAQSLMNEVSMVRPVL